MNKEVYLLYYFGDMMGGDSVSTHHSIKDAITCIQMNIDNDDYTCVDFFIVYKAIEAFKVVNDVKLVRV